jgi:hypothetical protein
MALTVTPQRRPVELARRVPVAVDAAVAALEDDPHGVIGSRLRAPMVAGVTYTKLGVEVLGGHQVVPRVVAASLEALPGRSGATPAPGGPQRATQSGIEASAANQDRCSAVSLLCRRRVQGEH